MKQTLTKLGGALLALFLLMPSSTKATITAKWDWKNNIPTGITSMPEVYRSTQSIESNESGVSMIVVATGDQVLRANGNNAQFNTGTILYIPVVSTSDIVTFTPHPSGYSGVTIGEDDYDDTSGTERTYSPTATEVTNGYVKIVSKGGYIYSVQVELAFRPIESNTVASWTFNTSYDVVSSIYVPNSNAWASIDWVWGDSQIQANEALGNTSDCLAYVKRDRAWRFDTRGGQYTLCLYSEGGTANDLKGDYSDGSKHNQYFQFSFPTLGLSNIKVSFAYTYYNSRAGKLELVYSTDGGTTWVDNGAYDTGADANTFAIHSDISLPVGNKNNVIVRLIQSDGVLDYCYLDYFTVTGKKTTTSISISAAKYATYYNTIPVQLPANLQAATIDKETSGTLTLNYRYGEDDVIPGGTPVLLKATTAGDYTLTYATNNTDVSPSGNLLYGSDIETTTTGGGAGAKYYALQYGTGGNADVLGFYWVNASGAAFTSGAHKAWLALPASTPANFFALDDETTGIKAVETSPVYAGKYYDLQGRQVAQPTKGLYIVNGKKVIIK